MPDALAVSNGFPSYEAVETADDPFLEVTWLEPGVNQMHFH